MSTIKGEWLFEMCPKYFQIKDIKNPETKHELSVIESDLDKGKTLKFKSKK